MSPKGLDHIREKEAFVPNVYDDGVGNRTIGFGHMLRPGESYSHLSQDEAKALFEKDVERLVTPVLSRIRIPLTQNQIDALGDFIFNVGPGNFIRSVLPNLNRGNHEGVLSSMFQFIKGRNQRTGERITLRGLLKRRQEEIALYKDSVARSSVRPDRGWSRGARQLLAAGMRFLRGDSAACFFDRCRRSRSPS